MRLSGMRARRLRRRLKRGVSPASGSAPLVSPLAPKAFPDLPAIGGLAVATGRTGLRYRGRDDLLLVSLAPGTSVAGVTTRSATRSAAVIDCARKLGQTGGADAGAAIVINAGNANTFTGRAGDATVAEITASVAGRLDLPRARVFSSSTGVIGAPLDGATVAACAIDLADRLSPGGLERAARAIMTTDTFPKGAGRTFDAGDRGRVSIAGIAKGSGMIAPDMATMLVYVFTDARIAPDTLQAMVDELNATTFNCITVDGDTSTSDTLLVAATGASGVEISRADSHAAEFREALAAVMLDLAHQVVRDGEGATKFVEVAVTGAAHDADARRVAGAIANSPLVKTAIAGEDPNWGRIVMAVGKSGASADRDRLTIRFGPHLVAEHGWVAESYTEAAGAAYMRRAEIGISVDLGLGTGAARMWTCDLTDRYIAINADYRS